MKKTNKRNWLFDLKTVAIMSLMLIASSATAQLNGTYTLHDDSPTAGTNFNNVKDLTDTLTAAGVSGPVVINIVPDTFAHEGQFKLVDISGLSSINTLTINGNNQEIVSDVNTLAFQNVSYVTVNNMKVRGTGLFNSTVFIKEECKYITFQNGEVITEGSKTSSESMHIQIGNGLYATSTSTSSNSNITIKGNTLHSNGSSTGAYVGIVCSSQDSATANQNILIENNTVQDFGRYGYYGRFNSGVIINRNNFSNNPATVNTGAKYGIYTYNSSFNTPRYSPKALNVIEKNFIGNLGDTLSIDYTYSILYQNTYAEDNVDITNNTISINTAGSLYGIRVSGASNSYTLTPGKKNIINNSIYVTGTKYNTSRWQRLIYSYYNEGNIQNNLMYCDAKNVYSNYGIQLASNTGTISHNNLDLRDMTYTSVAVNKFYVSTDNGTSSSTSAEFLTSSPSSTVINPKFNNELFPTSLSIMGKGTNVLSDDFNSNPRDTTFPDMGAYELNMDVSIDALNLTGTTECAPYTENFTIELTNTSIIPVTDIPVSYNLIYAGPLNPATTVTETVGDTMLPGETLSYTFTNPVTMTGNTVHTIYATLGVSDGNRVNNLQIDTITTVESPSGFAITPNSNFGGYLNDGNVINPDIVAFNYPSSYDVTYPSNVPYEYTLSATKAPGTDIGTTGDVVNSGDTLLTVNPSLTLEGDLIILTLTVKDSITGCTAGDQRFIRVPFVPVGDFVANNICLGDVAQFKNNTTLNGPGYINTKWEFNDPDASVTDDNSAIKDGFWKYTTYGNVDVDMTVSNGVYPKFEYTTTNSIIVTPKPVLDFKVLNACEGSPISIVNSSTLPVNGTITYDWDFGGEYTSTDVNPSYTFPTAGQRKIKVTATANGCTSTADKNTYQFEMPVADFNSIGECNFSEVQFTNGSTIAGGNMGYAWDFNGEGISREANPTFTFTAGGNKTISLTATSQFGCVNVITKGVALQESPEADFSFDRACNLTPINFTRTGFVPNNGDNSTYTWDFDGESTTSQENPSYLFNRVGSKDVTLTVEDLNGCSSTITKTLDVLLQANADFEVTDICQGQEAVFINKSIVASGNLSYEWSFGDGTTSTITSPTLTYSEAKTYNISLKASIEGGCSDETVNVLTVNPAPNAKFTIEKDGRQVEVDAPEGNDLYRWTFGDGGSSDQEDVTYVYENVDQKTFTVCLATKKDACWSEECKDITLNLAGIENLTENNDMITVYPNPSTGRFNVTVENAKDVVIKVGDILGNVLDVEAIDNYNGIYNIDLSMVADGIYFVQVKNGTFFATKRIKISK